MGIFPKKRNNEFFDIIESPPVAEELKDDDGRALAKFASHALTPEEIIAQGGQPQTGTPSGQDPLNALKKRMLEAVKSGEGGQADSQDKDSGPAADDNNSDDIKTNNSPADTTAKPAGDNPPSGGNKVSAELRLGTDFNSAGQGSTAQEKIIPPDQKENDPEPQNTKKTLLEKCKPYIIDEEGNDASVSTPLYTLESIADILRSDSEKTIDRLSKKYNITFDDLGQYPKAKNSSETKQSEALKPPLSSDKKAPLEKQIFEDVLNDKAQKSGDEISVISDIDSQTEIKGQTADDTSSDTGTVIFTPVRSSEDDKGRVKVSAVTRTIDLTGEFTQMADTRDERDAETKLEETEFEEYIPKREFSSPADGKRIYRALWLKKRNAFFGLCISWFFTLCLAAFKLPFLSGFLVTNVTYAMVVCSALLAIIIAANYRIFGGFARLFSRHCTPDANAALATVAVAAYTGYAIYKKENAFDLILLLGVILSVRALCWFMKQSYLLSNLSVIMNNTQKRAIKLIDDPAVCFAMAKNAVEGDVLIAAPRYTKHVDGYMKYSTFGILMGGRLPVITAVSLILSAIVGFSCAAYFEGAVYGFYGVGALLCLTALPPLFFIDNLPLYSASRKLNRIGAMIAGKTGAERVEQANAVVFNSEDLFPPGTVTLHNIKILSENNIDETILRAASLTTTVNSPLAPIFKQIAGNSNITALPDSDTVKYEDRMGLSGWVDNKLLFIGNRTLMEAHGIAVPDVEVDRKILRKGYFPVYLASEGKACAIIVIQYNVNPEISRELSRLTALGVTVLVNNCDPNLTEKMICDYLGLYEDSVKVMSSAGSHLYKNAINKVKSCVAPAAYKGNPVALASILNCAARIKKSNTLLTVLYVLAAIFGILVFAYTSFAGSGSLADGAFILIYGLISSGIAAVLYQIEKP